MDDAQALGTGTIRKLDQWFAGLTQEEQFVVGGMVHAALLYVAEQRAAADPATAGALPPFVAGLTEQNAPSLAAALNADVSGYSFNFGGGGSNFSFGGGANFGGGTNFNFGGTGSGGGTSFNFGGGANFGGGTGQQGKGLGFAGGFGPDDDEA